MIFKINPNVSLREILKKVSNGDTIYLSKGIYREKIEIFEDNVTIIGEDKENTIIVNHDFYHKIMPDNKECNTFRTYTVFCGGNNMKIKNITIENSSVPSTKYGQAVALHVSSSNFLCENCILKSNQDTLFTGPLPEDLQERYANFLDPRMLVSTPSKQIYKDTTICGDVDFIFGCATVLFDNCDIVCLKRDENKSISYVCAPAHSYDTKYGYLFYKCNIITQDDGGEVYLARPWRDYGLAAFIECSLGEYISPLGFNKWNNTSRDKTARFYEFSPNYDISKRVPWAHQLTKDEAETYYKDFLAYLD